MQLPLPADVLVPLGIGAVVAVVAVAALVLGLRKRGDESPAPTDADWTGENVGVAVAPARREQAVAVKRTVADAIAARRADTDPFPAVPPAATPARSGSTAAPKQEPARGVTAPTAPPASAPAATTPRSAGTQTSTGMHAPTSSPDPGGVRGSAQAPGADGQRTTQGSPARAGAPGGGSVDARERLVTPPPPAGASVFGAPPVRGMASPRPTPSAPSSNGDSASGAQVSSPEPAPESVPGVAATVSGLPVPTPPDQHDQAAEPGSSAEDAADPHMQARHAADNAGPAGSTDGAQGPMGHDDPDPAAPTAIPHQSSIAAGSSRNVGNAVAHVLAARAAAPAPVSDRRGDARDRLLAVLLDDPLRAVGATVDLQDCQERMDRLTSALNDERTRLRDVLGRLARSGLRADQLARLSGLSDSEVAELLRRNNRP